MLAATAFAALSIGWSSSASAAPYVVDVCSTFANATDGLFYLDPVGKPDPIFTDACKSTVADGIRQGTTGGGKVPKDSGRAWELRAPEGAHIKTLDLVQSFSHTGAGSFLDWRLMTSNSPIPLFSFRDDRALPPESFKSYQVNALSVQGILRCEGDITVRTCLDKLEAGSFSVTLRNLTAVLEDDVLPTVPKPEPAANPARGTIDVATTASDLGSGVTELSLFVDGVKLAGRHDDNGGKCQVTYRFVAPCKPEVAASFPLDTTKLAEGQHELIAVAIDASGQQNVSGKTLLTVRNTPVASDRPVIAGLARVGTQLKVDNGRWEGSPTAFFRQWLRCPATTSAPGDMTGCVEIPDARAPEYTATEADADKRLVTRVTAVNANGVGAVLSVPTAAIASGLDKTAPLLKKVVLTRKRLTFSRPKGGATSLRFVSNEDGKVTIAVEKKQRKGKYKRVLPLAAEIKAGPSTVPMGPILAAKKLGPGSYRITITVRDAGGNLSEASRVTFKILRR